MPSKMTPGPLNGCLCQDGSCEACNRLGEAFKAMREAIDSWCKVIHRCDDTYKLATDAEAPEVMGRMRAALALADKVKGD